jgi:hypothetical protein
MTIIQRAHFIGRFAAVGHLVDQSCHHCCIFHVDLTGCAIFTTFIIFFYQSFTVQETL